MAEKKEKIVEAKKTIKQMWFRSNRVKDKQKEGWKLVEVNGHGDLTLMEKEN